VESLFAFFLRLWRSLQTNPSAVEQRNSSTWLPRKPSSSLNILTRAVVSDFSGADLTARDGATRVRQRYGCDRYIVEGTSSHCRAAAPHYHCERVEALCYSSSTPYNSYLPWLSTPPAAPRMRSAGTTFSRGQHTPHGIGSRLLQAPNPILKLDAHRAVRRRLVETHLLRLPLPPLAAASSCCREQASYKCTTMTESPARGCPSARSFVLAHRRLAGTVPSVLRRSFRPLRSSFGGRSYPFCTLTRTRQHLQMLAHVYSPLAT